MSPGDSGMNSRRIRALVIGAGPAGACAASVLARELGPGSTALVERAAWPRAKVCGCCLGAAGVQLLIDHEMAIESGLAQGARLVGVEVRCRGQGARVRHAGGIAIARDRLDAMLVGRAMEQGAAFLDATSARALGHDGTRWRVELRTGAESDICECELLLVADGLGGSSLVGVEGMGVRVARDAWMGVSTIVGSGRVCDDAMGEIGYVRMYVGKGGYVGTVRLRDGEIAIAAALDPSEARGNGGPRALMERIVVSTGVASLYTSGPERPEERLMGSGLLTRRRARIAMQGLLVIGDSAGYVEPFTGEGMTWAIASGVRAAELGAHALRRGTMNNLAEQWTREHERLVRRRQRTCRGVRWLVHHPACVSGVLGSMARSGLADRAATLVARAIGSAYGQVPGEVVVRTGVTP